MIIIDRIAVKMLQGRGGKLRCITSEYVESEVDMPKYRCPFS
jgi:hypothetical protein